MRKRLNIPAYIGFESNGTRLLLKRKYRSLRRRRLWNILVDGGIRVIQWIFRFSWWAILTSIMAAAIVESWLDEDQIEWWK